MHKNNRDVTAADKRSLKRIRKRIAAALLGAAMAVSSFQTAYATKQDVEAAKKKVSSIEEEKKKVQATIKNLEGLKNDAAAYVKELDGNLTKLEGELDELSSQISTKEQEIADTGIALEQSKATENKQYADMKLRIKYMYEQGNTNYIDMLFQSEDMVQLMNRAEYINKMSSYDRKKLDEYAATRQAIADEEQKVKDDKAALVDMQEKTKAKQESVKTLRAQKNKEMQSYAGQIDTAQSQVDQYNADLVAQENKIKQIEAEIKRKEEEERKKAEAARKAEEEARKKAEAEGKKVSATDKAASYNVASLGNISFKWPCPSSSRISSGFGSRTSPTKGASSNHQGIDIPASTGAAIVASASGTVVVSTYSYSAGNYIMISHGGGVYTVYMHCSQLLASEGQTVKQGQTIAKVGSTGYSTGSHLHFGIRSGGRYVNPQSYVSP